MILGSICYYREDLPYIGDIKPLGCGMYSCLQNRLHLHSGRKGLVRHTDQGMSVKVRLMGVDKLILDG